MERDEGEFEWERERRGGVSYGECGEREVARPGKGGEERRGGSWGGVALQGQIFGVLMKK